MMRFAGAMIIALHSFLSGLIIESDSLQKCFDYHEPGTWIICDIDNTLIESCQQLGTVQWAEHLKKRLCEIGLPTDKVIKVEREAWEEVQQKVEVRLVKEETARVLKELSQRQAHLMALTARGFEEKASTEGQLKSCGIDFSLIPPLKKSFIEKIGGEPILYENGILYATNGLKKSEALLRFFRKMDQKPKKIIFIDDKMHHVQDVQNLMTDLGISFVGIRFTAADARVKVYNPEVAKLQWQRLPEHLSDEEATLTIQAQKDGS